MNKLFLTLILLTNLPQYVSSMSSEETACFLSFKEHKKNIPGFSYKNLAPEDQEVLVKNVLYRNSPALVRSAIKNYAAAFCEDIKKTPNNFHYDADMLGATLLKIKIGMQNEADMLRSAMQNKDITKPTDFATARMYVFTQLLTPEEKASVLCDNYLRNPELAHQAMIRCGILLAQELAKLNLIEDTAEAKATRAREFTEMKIAELEKTYKNA